MAREKYVTEETVAGLRNQIEYERLQKELELMRSGEKTETEEKIDNLLAQVTSAAGSSSTFVTQAVPAVEKPTNYLLYAGLAFVVYYFFLR